VLKAGAVIVVWLKSFAVHKKFDIGRFKVPNKHKHNGLSGPLIRETYKMKKLLSGINLLIFAAPLAPGHQCSGWKEKL